MNFTPHPLPDVSLFLLDKTAEMIQSFAVVAVCVHMLEIVQRQRRDLLQLVTVPCGTIPLCRVFSQNL